MKITVMSDLHLEGNNITLENSDNADVLVLAGDICCSIDFDGYHSEKLYNFFNDCSSKFKYTIYVLGNHEYYRGDIANEHANIVDKLSKYNNVYVLENEIVELDGVMFVGSTLWTDMNKEDTHTLMTMKDMMNDFRIIYNSNVPVQYRTPIYDSTPKQHYYDLVDSPKSNTKTKISYKASKYTPQQSVELHRQALDYINLICRLHDDKPIVLVTHHSPSYKSIAPTYEHDSIVNGAYHSDCEWLYHDNDNIVAHFFGHTHERHAYYINNTIIMNNSRGYRNEKHFDSFKPITVDLDNLPSKDELLNDDYWLFHPKNNTICINHKLKYIK